MSKLKRSVLKSVVKECLLEILSEGIGTNTNAAEIIQSRGNAAAQQDLSESTERHTQNNSMKDAIAGITDDPILAEVLGDTAQTTLVEQTSADRKGQLRKMRATSSHPAGTSEQSQEPDGNSHWAALAFADKK
jgi:hypothetical protein